MCEDIIAMSPEIPSGYTQLGWVYHHDYVMGNTKSPRKTLEKAMELAQKALAMDESQAPVHALLCSLYILQRDYDRAIAEGERALALLPGGTDLLVEYAGSLTCAGRVEEAIPLYQKAIRLTPFGRSSLYFGFGDALRITGRFKEAVSAYKKAIQIAPDSIIAHLGLAAAYSLMGRETEAQAEAAELLRINPKFSLDYDAKILPYKDQSVRDRYVAALRKAGLK